MNKRAILISEDDEVYCSFKRALKFVDDIEIMKFSGKFKKKLSVIYDINNVNLDSWLWGDFRTKKKALNPLIVIGTEERSRFLTNQPVFNTYSNVHAYFQIPFDLKELINSINTLKPIYDDITRKLIVDEYSKGYEYILITHDLKIIKRDLDTTIDNIVKVRDFYHYRDKKKISKIIDDKIIEMQTKGNWEEIAFEIKQYLEERLKGN